LHRVQVEIEGRDDTEIAAAPAHAPQQVRVLFRARVQDLATPGDDLRRTDVVECEPETPRHPTESAANGQATDAGVRHRARRRHQPLRHRLAVEIAEQAAAGNPRDTPAGVDAHTAQQREVEQQAAFAGRLARRAVAAALHGQQQVRCAREIDRLADVGGAARLHDECGLAIHLRVPDAPCRIVGRMARQDQVAAQALAEILDARARQRDGAAIEGHGVDVPVDGREGSEHRTGDGPKRERGGRQRGAAHEESSVHGSAPLLSRRS
jgi:hypothetical protein